MNKFNFKNKSLKRKLLFITIPAFIITMCTLTGVNAASITQTIRATQGVKILYNGQQLTDSTNQPYIINSSTYIPLRMLMTNFGDKSISWDATNYQVVITDQLSSSEAVLKAQIVQKDAQIAKLTAKVNELLAQIDDEDTTDTSELEDIEDAVNDYLADAGNDYFDDDNIDTSITLTGSSSAIYYTATLDFGDSDTYDDLTEVNQGDIKSFMYVIKARIANEITDTDYDDATITGKVVDRDDSSNYAKFNGSTYTYSWDEDEIDLDDVEETLEEYFEDAGDDYFGDDNIVVTSITLSGDEDDLEYSVELDLSDSTDYVDLTDISETKIRSFLNALKSKINTEIDDTDYEDADLTGELSDDNNKTVEYDGSTYTFSWD